MSLDSYISENFLLNNDSARRLYFEYAEELPIIDYHNHLPPSEIADDCLYSDLTALWLSGDHYKWRAMRNYGVPESFITGPSSAQEKFIKWAEVVPYTLCNPLYHWTHLELKRYFNIDELLNLETASRIYDKCNVLLRDQAYSSRSLLKKMKVEALCTTDDPVDSLEDHARIKTSESAFRVYPAFRPDRALLINGNGFLAYLADLESAAGSTIISARDVVDALTKRMEFFMEQGCFLCDHGLNYIPNRTPSLKSANRALQDKRDGQVISTEAAEDYLMYVLFEMCKRYHRFDWTLQLHLGAARNNNTAMLSLLGPDAGFDSIGVYPQLPGLHRLLDLLNTEGALPRTIVYHLNPADGPSICTMLGNFQSGKGRSRLQYGAAWWFLDQRDGILDQLKTLSNMGMLRTFIGMLTDSRSFLSFPRHEYFRRILCDWLGSEMESGQLPRDYSLVGATVKQIAYTNVKEFFSL